MLGSPVLLFLSGRSRRGQQGRQYVALTRWPMRHDLGEQQLVCAPKQLQRRVTRRGQRQQATRRALGYLARKTLMAQPTADTGWLTVGASRTN